MKNELVDVKQVYICGPYQDDPIVNSAKARLCGALVRYMLSTCSTGDVNVFVPHEAFPSKYGDSPEERAIVMSKCLFQVEKSMVLIVIGDHITEVMRDEILYALKYSMSHDVSITIGTLNGFIRSLLDESDGDQFTRAIVTMLAVIDLMAKRIRSEQTELGTE